MLLSGFVIPFATGRPLPAPAASGRASPNWRVSGEAVTCRNFVVPRPHSAGWDNARSIAEQRYFSAGRIVSQGRTDRQHPSKRADHPLRYTQSAASLRKALDQLQRVLHAVTAAITRFARQ